MSLLPNQFRIPDDFLGRLDRNEPPPAAPVSHVPSCDWSCAQASDKPPKMVRLRLTDEWEAEAADFEREHGDRGCTCFISPPCSHCMHPGNPLNLAETPEAWVMGYEDTAAPASDRPQTTTGATNV